MNDRPNHDAGRPLIQAGEYEGADLMTFLPYKSTP